MIRSHAALDGSMAAANLEQRKVKSEDQAQADGNRTAAMFGCKAKPGEAAVGQPPQEEQQEQQGANNGNNTPCKLFIGGLSWQTTSESLREYFSRYGDLDDVVVMTEKATGQSRGFGFVVFKEHDKAVGALQEAHVVDGRQVDAKMAVSREAMWGAPASGGPQITPLGAASGGSQITPRVTNRQAPIARTKKVFVGGISQGVSEEDFKSHFEKYGAVADSIIMKFHGTNKSRGFGFVTFESEDAVHAVMAEAHTLDNKTVEVKLAEPQKREMPSRVIGRVVGFGYAHGRGSGMPMRGGGMGMIGVPQMGMRYDRRDDHRLAWGGPPDGMGGYGRYPYPYSEAPPVSPYPTHDPSASYAGGGAYVGHMPDGGGYAGQHLIPHGSGASVVDPSSHPLIAQPTAQPLQPAAQPLQPAAQPLAYEAPYAATSSNAYGASNETSGASSYGYPPDQALAAAASGVVGYNGVQPQHDFSAAASGAGYGGSGGAYGSSNGAGGAGGVPGNAGGGAVAGYGPAVSASTGVYASAAYYGAGAANPTSYTTPAQPPGRLDRSYHPYK